MKIILAALFSLAVFPLGLSSHAMAQSTTCTITVHVCVYDAGGGRLVDAPPVPVGSTCINSGPFCADCTARNNQCAPPNAADEVCLTCMIAKMLQAQVGAPIILSTGNTYITQTDISVPGLGGGLTLSRTWNSKLPAVQSGIAGMFGMNWRSNYEERLIFNSSDNYMKRSMGDGSVWSFGVSAVGSSLTYQPAAPANDTTALTTGDTVYTLVAKNGEKRTFDNITGALLSIADRNGNTTLLTYDASHRLATVTDPASRHLNFNYPDANSTLVSSVTSDVGITASYSYDGQGRLATVTKPDGTTVSFDYDAQSKITAVRDGSGKILESHSYDVLGRGTSSSRANGVESVTVSYPQ